MATKLQELLEELKGLKRFDIDPVDNGEFIEKEYRYEEEGMFIESSLLDQLIAKYTETTPTYKPGDSVRVIDCLKGHEFKLKEIIKLLEYDSVDQMWYCTNHTGNYWWLNIEEFEPIK